MVYSLETVPSLSFVLSYKKKSQVFIRKNSKLLLDLNFFFFLVQGVTI